MQKFITAVAVAALVAGASPVAAQEPSAGDAAAFAALITTPYGALPAVAARDAKSGASLDVRYGRYSFEGTDLALHNYGIGGSFNAAGGRMGVMLGMISCEDCDGAKMAGVDYSRSLMSRPVGASKASFSLGVHPAVGYGKPDEGEGSSLSFAVDIPASISMSMSNGMEIVSFLAPGYGYGRVSDGTENESGTRPVIGGGVGLLNIGGGLGVNLGFRKIFLDEAPTQWGLGLSWGR